MSNVERAEIIFKNGSKTFYNATKFFPESVRKDITNLYAFVRVADQYVDSSPQKPLELSLMRSSLQKVRNGELSGDSIVDTFGELEARVGFDPLWADAFLDSMEQDLHKTVIETEAELRKYCYGSAAVIGLFVSAIVGTHTEAYPHAEALGNAFQFINFIRDIDEDLVGLGRVYIPRDEIVRCGLTGVSQEEARRNPTGFKQLMQLQIERYQKEQALGVEGVHYLPKSARTAILTASEMYAWTAEQILADPYVIYRRKVKPSKLRILLTGLRLQFAFQDKPTHSFAHTEETNYTR